MFGKRTWVVLTLVLLLALIAACAPTPQVVEVVVTPTPAPPPIKGPVVGDERVAIFTNDVTPESADRVAEGKMIAETTHGFPDWGWYGTEFAVTIVCGGEVPQIFDIRPRTMYIENARLFYPEPALEPIDWEAIKAAGQCPDEITICWTPPDITGVFRTATDYWLLSAMDAQAHGIFASVISQAPTSHIAFGDQVGIIEDFVARECDAIGISPIEVEVVIPAIQKANEAGIPVIIVNLLEPIAGVEVASYIGFDNTIAARISGFALVDYFGGPGVLGTGREVEVEPGTYLDLAWWEELYETVTDEEREAVTAKVAIIEGIAGGFFSTARVNGFHSIVDEFPGIEIVGEPCAADWNREKGIGCAEDFLTAYTDLDAIWAASNEMGLGAMLAAEAAGRLELAE